ncbi:hypothetical protein [Phenylobacterium sp.]|uniref:hypothetical protein n=1 Tax=Phenylobacterium sp. TaxID=1871053 RepID=UPI002FCAE4BD
MLQLIEAVCEPGAVANEDIWGEGGGAAWIMDGATGVSSRRHLPGASDAAWFVGQSHIALGRHFAAGGSLDEIFQAVVEEVAVAARATCDIEAMAPHERPSASLAAIRASEQGLELANLGDCTLLWRTVGGKACRFGSSAVAALDGRLHARIAQDLSEGKSIEQARLAAGDLARHHRTLMNRPDGYWIFDISGDGVAHIQTETVVVTDAVEVLLMTDGFYRLVDTYGRYGDDELFDAAAYRGLSALYGELRAIEADDMDCRTYLRGKSRDDATAVMLRAS